jgi:hypothetical protein
MVDVEDHRFVIIECLKEAKRRLSARESIPDALYAFAFAWVNDRRISTAILLNSDHFHDEKGSLNGSEVSDFVMQVLDAKSEIHADLTNRMGTPPEILALCRRDKIFSLDPNRAEPDKRAGDGHAIDSFGVFSSSTEGQLVALAPILSDRAGLGAAQIYLVMEGGFKPLGTL